LLASVSEIATRVSAKGGYGTTHSSRFVSAAVLGLAQAPPAAFAQAVVAGVIKDASGAVLPGVTVEATSPATIEKVRSAVSDGAGQYRIVDVCAMIADAASAQSAAQIRNLRA